MSARTPDQEKWFTSGIAFAMAQAFGESADAGPLKRALSSMGIDSMIDLQDADIDGFDVENLEAIFREG